MVFRTPTAQAETTAALEAMQEASKWMGDAIQQLTLRSNKVDQRFDRMEASATAKQVVLSQLLCLARLNHAQQYPALTHQDQEAQSIPSSPLTAVVHLTMPARGSAPSTLYLEEDQRGQELSQGPLPPTGNWTVPTLQTVAPTTGGGKQL